MIKKNYNKKTKLHHFLITNIINYNHLITGKQIGRKSPLMTSYITLYCYVI
jgi:hypothetical protein